jgi:ABC-type Fe3+-hydroxamate transport system substrate-binding protein
MNIDIEDISKALNRAKEAQDLLDSILSYYNIYSGQFDKIRDIDAKYLFKLSDGSYYKYGLNTRIRAYIKFDDSE